jgi:hypothetical protein
VLVKENLLWKPYLVFRQNYYDSFGGGLGAGRPVYINV